MTAYDIVGSTGGLGWGCLPTCKDIASVEWLEIDLIFPQQLYVPRNDFLFRSLAQNFCTTCNRKVRSLEGHNKSVHYSRDQESETFIVGKLCTVCGKQFK